MWYPFVKGLKVKSEFSSRNFLQERRPDESDLQSIIDKDIPIFTDLTRWKSVFIVVFVFYASKTKGLLAPSIVLSLCPSV